MRREKQGLELWGLSLQLPASIAGKLANFLHNNTADRNYTLPDKDGTFAMLSDITITANGGVGITRQTIVITTDILASSAKKIGIVSLAKSAMIVSVGTDYPAWVRIYNDAVSLVADNTRQITTWPTAGTGIVLDVVTTVAIPVIKQSPGELFANNNTPTDSSCYILITNLDSVARAITLTIVYLPLEV